MNAIPKHALLAGIGCLLLSAPAVQAEKADRDKPVNIEADRVSVDDVKKLQTFEGNVQLAKGTLVIRAERILVQQDDDGYQRGVATGSAGVLSTTPGRRRQSSSVAPGSRAALTKCAGNSFPMTHAASSTW